MKGKIKQEIEDDWGFGESPPENGRVVGTVRSSKSLKKPRTRKRKPGERLSEDNCEGFVKKELDAIEALVEFAQLPFKGASPEHTDDVIYTWAVKRRRSIGSKKSENSPSAEPGNLAESSAISLKHEASGRVYLQDVLKAEANKNASSESSKESSFKDSRAESPNSPLPALQDGCLTSFKIIVPKVEEDLSLPATLRRPSSLAARTSKSLFLGSIKVEKDVEQGGIAKCFRALPSITRKACRPSAGLKREDTPQDSDSDSSFKCKQSLEKGPTELDASCQAICLFKPLKPEAKPEPSFDCASSDIRIGQKLVGRHSGKQKVIILSESEKEARRLRRIQANRESARQTIRRKQILCEELTKRANELVLMNENMKQERAILKQECQSLHEHNCFLKQQVTSIDILDSCKASSQPLADVIQPSSSHAIPFPFAPLISLPYQAYPWALHPRKAGSMGCDLLQGEAEKSNSSETAGATSYGESVALGFWLAMRTNMHMPMPVSSSPQLATVVHTPDRAKLGSSFSSVPEGVVEDSLVSGRVENSTTAGHCFQEIGDLELVQVDNNSQEQKIEPQCLNSVSPANDIEAVNVSVQSSGPQNGINWHLTESLPWDQLSPYFPIKPSGRQSQHSLTFEMHKQYPSIERKELDLLLQGHQQQIASFFGRRDGAAVAKAAEARRRRKQITRKKSLLRLRSSKC